MLNRTFRVLAISLAALLTVVPAFAQKEYSIAAIQGTKNVSPLENEAVRVQGIVTARTRTGFFIQTPDAQADKDPATSEGIFIYTRSEPPSEATVGNLVSLTGRVEEFRPRGESGGLSVTEVSMRTDRDDIRVVSKGVPLPAPAVINAAVLRPDGGIDQLERFEGMRVTVEVLTVSAPTGGRVDIPTASSVSNGTFFGVVKGTPRPFREPGLDIFEFLSLSSKDRDKLKQEHPKLPVFDGNPERIRIESTAQLGSGPIDVAAQSDIKGLTGVMHYNFRSYTLFVDPSSPATVSATIKPAPLPDPTDRQFAVAGMNLENFFDDEDDPAIKEDILTAAAFERRLKKISAVIRDYLRTPAIIGVVEVENLPALRRLAERLNADAVAAGRPDPKYQAFLAEGNDGRGIDNGFLVSTARVKVIDVKQVGKDEKYKNPLTGDEIFLNDRPPLVLRAAVTDPRSGTPIELTVVANHLKSFLGYNDPKQSDNVRMKKRLQAEFLAKWAASEQKEHPDVRILLLGDLNAYQFSDGIVDVVGTIKGTPAAADQVINPSLDLVDPDLFDLVDSISAASRYSYVFDGNAQAIDHMIVNDALRKFVIGFGYARVNADHPEIYRNDATRPERYSDHDPAIAYFSFEPRAARQ